MFLGIKGNLHLRFVYSCNEASAILRPPMTSPSPSYGGARLADDEALKLSRHGVSARGTPS